MPPVPLKHVQTQAHAHSEFLYKVQYLSRHLHIATKTLEDITHTALAAYILWFMVV